MSTLLEADKVADKVVEQMEKIEPSRNEFRVASDVALSLGFISIVASIATWFMTKPKDAAHSERFGIFIGLWVPSFFILANHLARRADSRKEI
jgi:hypothetical protein